MSSRLPPLPSSYRDVHSAAKRLRSIATTGGLLATPGGRPAAGPGSQDAVQRAYALKRLTDETVRLNGVLAYENGFTYDAASNRLTQTHTTTGGASTTSYTYDARDRLLTEGRRNYTWDANGNMSGRDGAGGSGEVWDFEDRLVKVTMADGNVVEHTYDADGNRVRTKVTPPIGAATTTDYILDAAGGLSQVVADVQSGAIATYYVRTPELIGVLRGAVSKYVHADGLGSTRGLTDAGGATTDGYAYSAFGEPLSHSGADAQPFTFAGEAWQPETVLAYHRARWMDPRNGGFISSDPFSATILFASHSYSYADSQPTISVDPSGLFAEAELPIVNVGSGIVAANQATAAALGAKQVLATILASGMVFAPIGSAIRGDTDRPRGTMRVHLQLRTPDGKTAYTYGGQGPIQSDDPGGIVTIGLFQRELDRFFRLVESGDSAFPLNRLRGWLVYAIITTSEWAKRQKGGGLDRVGPVFRPGSSPKLSGEKWDLDTDNYRIGNLAY